MSEHIFSEITLLVAVAAGISLLMRLLRQPLIIGYILTGLIVGPATLGLVQSPEMLGLLGKFGIALLLFIVGLGLNPKTIKEVGRVALLTGVGQVLFTSAIGYSIVRALGHDPVAALYIAVALSFSSTIIILKLLSDKKEQNKLHGKISIGFLLVQDIIAAFALVAATATGNGGLNLSQMLVLGLRGAGLLVLIFGISMLIVSRMTKFLSGSQELLFLFAIAWGFGVAAISHELGFSLEVGALFAGVALASKSYAQEISARLRPLRDFFIIVFFIGLGAGLNIATVGSLMWQAIILSGFVLVGNPIIVMTLMGLLGYTKRTSFKAGLTVAQISEFSLIFILIGASGGQVGEDIVALVAIVAIITIALSTYMITYSDKLYSLIENYLKLFERRKIKKEHTSRIDYDFILFGYQRGGSEFVKLFKSMGKKYVVIDYDPEAIDQLTSKNIPYLYGDATDPELLEEAGISKVRLIISAITDHEANTALLKYMTKVNPGAIVICHAATINQAEELYSLGASYVMLPHYIGTEHISAFIKSSRLNKAEFKKYRSAHLEYLLSHYDDEAE